MTGEPTPHHSSEQIADGALAPYLHALRRHLWVVIAVAIVAGAAATLISIARSPRYDASTQMLIAPLSQGDTPAAGVHMLQDSGDPTRTMQTAAAIIESPAAAGLTARRIGSGYDQRSVEAAIDVQPLGESNIVSVTAEADSPRRAVRLADTYADAVIDLRQASVRRQVDAMLTQLRGRDGDAARRERAQLNAVRQRGDQTISIAQPAQLPHDPSGPPRWMVVALALIGGAALGLIVALLMDRLDRRVRDESELLDRVPQPVLVRIPRMSRGRTALDVPPAVREAHRLLQIQLDRQRGDGCRCVVVTSPSSGDGKTTTVLNLAFALVGAGHRVIVLDLDLRHADLARELGIEDGTPLATMLGDRRPLRELLRAAPRLPPLRVVATSGGVGDVALLPVLARRIEELLAEADGLADYVLIDTAPLGEVGYALALAARADELLLTARVGNTDRRSLELMSGLLARSSLSAAGWVLTAADDTGYQYVPPSPRRGRRRRSPTAAS